MPEYTYRANGRLMTAVTLGCVLSFRTCGSGGLTAHEAIAAVEQKVASELAAIRASDDTPPQSLSDHCYSGKFVVRISPMLHASLAVEAAEQGVSLNQWVVQRLAGRPSVSLRDLY